MSNHDPIWGALNEVHTYQASQKFANYLLGPSFAGWIAHLILFGIVVASTWEYLGTRRFNSDTKRLKLLVTLVVVLETINAVLIAEQITNYGLTQNRTIPYIFVVRLVDCFTPLLSGAVTALGQAYLIRRASFLFMEPSNYRLVFIIVAYTLCALAFALSLITTVIYLLYTEGITPPFKDPTDITIFLAGLFGGWLWTTATADVIITVTLYLLLKHKIKGFSTSTDNFLRRMMAVSVRTALFPSFFAVIGACLSVSFLKGDLLLVNVSSAFVYPLSSLYTLAFLSILRAREDIIADETVTTSHANIFQVSTAFGEASTPPSREELGRADSDGEMRPSEGRDEERKCLEVV